MTQQIDTSASERLPAHVLVVEDDAVLGLTIEQALLDAGVAQVVLSASTEEALRRLREERPDVIVLDVHLADRDDGWAIAELVRTLGPDSPRIIFSTGAPQDIPENVAALGCTLEKPYDAAVLVDLLRQPRRRGIISRLRGALRPFPFRFDRLDCSTLHGVAPPLTTDQEKRPPLQSSEAFSGSYHQPLGREGGLGGDIEDTRHQKGGSLASQNFFTSAWKRPVSN